MAVIIQIQEALDKLTNISRDDQIFYPRLRDEVKSAFGELNNLKCLLEDKMCVKKLNLIDSQWQLKCLQSVHMVQDIADTFLVKSSLQIQKGLFKMQLLTALTSFKFQNDLAGKINKVRLSINALTDLASRVTSHIPSNGSVDIPAASSSESFSKTQGLIRRVTNKFDDDEALRMVGFVEEVEFLCECLLDNASKLHVITILGVPGSGKTTLTKMVYNLLKIKNHFWSRAWVQVPHGSSSPPPLLDDIIQQIKTKIIVSTIYDLPLDPEDLSLSFLRSRRFFIVIEDVNEIEVWEKLRHDFPAICEKGSKVLITTRNIDLALHASTSKNPIQLHKLSDKDSWSLFLRNACIKAVDFNKSELSIMSSVVNIKERILRQCEGLPLAIVILGGLLSTKELSVYQWLKVINEHATNASGNHDQSAHSKIIDLSFDYLPDHIKSCFIYLAIFPKAFEIPVRRLVHLWTAEGLISENSSSDKTPEDVAEEYFNIMVDRNLIEVTQRGFKGRAKKCRLLSVIHDAILAKQLHLGYVYIHRDYNSDSSPSTVKPLSYNVRRLVQYSDIKSYPSSNPYIQYIRSYISFNNRRRDSPTTEVGTLLSKTMAKRGFGLLRVIDLEGVYKPMLPDAFGKLLHLRYLGLRWTFLDSLPMSVGELPLLETLDIKHTSISRLFSSIWKAKNLRHLYMNEIHLDVSIELRFGESLAKLQTLRGLVIGAKSAMAKGLKFLVNLRKLGLTCHANSIHAVVESISQLDNLQSLRVRSIDEHGLPSNLSLGKLRQHTNLADLYLLGKLAKALETQDLPQNLNVLTLSLSELNQDPMPILGALQQLRTLNLYGKSYLGEQMKCPGHSFPSLYELKLWKLENLKEWKVEDGAMPALKQLEIRCCYKLRIIKGMQQLQALKELTLTNMPEALFGDLKASLGSKVFIKENRWRFSNS